MSNFLKSLLVPIDPLTLKFIKKKFPNLDNKTLDPVGYEFGLYNDVNPKFDTGQKGLKSGGPVKNLKGVGKALRGCGKVMKKGK